MTVGGLRDALARALVVLACLLLPVAVVSGWLATVVSDPDRYVATVGPLAEDPTVQRAVEAELQRVVLQRVRLPSPLQGELERRLPALVERVVEGAEFRPAWEAANRSAHEQLVAALEGESERLSVADGQVSVRLGTLIDAVFAILVEEGVLRPGLVPEVEASFPVMSEARLTQARDGYRLLDRLGTTLPLAVTGAALAAVLLARRRAGVLLWLGWGAVLAAVALGLALVVARGQVLDAVGTGSVREVADAIWRVLTSRLRWWLGVLAGAGVLLALAGAVVRRRGDRAPTASARAAG